MLVSWLFHRHLWDSEWKSETLIRYRNSNYLLEHDCVHVRDSNQVENLKAMLYLQDCGV